ncbi:hypothetical protein HAX54_010824 [Datura stramonium]|uniref:Uncharacterized protein n=1 Tax=Datura stramonium TaxID=4076 RepID=A0ABS8THW8_DATST|nr:hypothetical protein [Datura stramonium]
MLTMFESRIYVDTELKDPPKKSQGHPPQLREEEEFQVRSVYSQIPVDRTSEGQNAETIETQATSTLSETLNDASICPGASLQDTRIPDEASEHSSEKLKLKRNSNVATDNDRHASDQVSRAGGCETFNVGHQLSHSAASLSDNVSKIVVACVWEKKKKRILQKADAAGDTSDLYMAFKGPKEKPQSSVSSESVEDCFQSHRKENVIKFQKRRFSANEDKGTGEPNNWEDTAKRKGSRIFLLTLSSHFADLPTNFEVPWHMMEALLSPKASISKGIDFNKNDPNPYPGQTNSRQCSSSWSENRPTGMADDGRWTNEQYMDINLGGSTAVLVRVEETTRI